MAKNFNSYTNTVEKHQKQCFLTDVTQRRITSSGLYQLKTEFFKKICGKKYMVYILKIIVMFFVSHFNFSKRW